jgi:hypothetical protein
MPATDTLFDKWRAADREAHTLERALMLATVRALETGGDPPTDEQWQAARSLRGIANGLFQLAMAELTAPGRGRRPDSEHGQSLT